MSNPQSISNQIQKLQSEYNKKLKELNRQLEQAIIKEKANMIVQMGINPKDSIMNLNLSNRANIILNHMGVKTIEDLLKLTISYLMEQRNCGKKILTEIERLFEEQLGLELPLK